MGTREHGIEQSTAWRDLDGYIEDAMSFWRASGMEHAATFEASRRHSAGRIEEIALVIGGRMEFQDTQPTESPGMEARYRITVEGRDPMVFDGLKELGQWLAANRPLTKSLAARAAIAASTPATSLRARRRSL